MAVNPNYPETVLPLDTAENHQFTGDDEKLFFLNMIDELVRREVEVVTIVCEDCPAQVNRVTQALTFRSHLGIVHIQCFCHMINLVFSHLLNDEDVAPRMTILRDITSHLRSDHSRQVLMHKCPTLLQTRWVYAV
jgi:hypothetical protein